MTCSIGPSTANETERSSEEFFCAFCCFFIGVWVHIDLFVCLFFTVPGRLWDYNPKHGLSWVFLASCVVGKAQLGKKEQGKQNKLKLSCRII